MSLKPLAEYTTVHDTKEARDERNLSMNSYRGGRLFLVWPNVCPMTSPTPTSNERDMHL